MTDPPPTGPLDPVPPVDPLDQPTESIDLTEPTQVIDPDAQPGDDWGGGGGGGDGEGPGDEDDRSGRGWMWLAVVVLALLGGVIGYLLATGGDDEGGPDTTSSTSSTTTEPDDTTTSSPSSTTSSTSSSTTSSTTSTTAPPSGPTITSLEASEVSCPDPITLTWTSVNATSVEVAIDNPGGVFDTGPPNGSMEVPAPCGGDTQTYFVTAIDELGDRNTRTLQLP